MTVLDLDFVRSQFPAFAEASLQGFAHFDNAGGSYACRQTIEWLERYYRQTKVQPYNDYPASRLAGEQMDAAKERMAGWLNVAPDDLHFGPSSSQNTYVVAQALRQWLKPGDEVIVTNQDHEANVGVWTRLADAGVVVREWKIEPATAELRTADLEALLGPRTRVVAFTHCSNIVGSINPVREWTDLVHRVGARAIVDGVSFCPHGLPDIPSLGADIYLFSLYKVYGPHLGVMYVASDFAGELPHQGHFFNAGRAAHRFVPAGADHAQVASVNGVLDYMEAVAQRHGIRDGGTAPRARAVHTLFRDQETALLQPLLDFLSKHPRIRMIGRDRAPDRAPTVAFTVDDHRSTAVARRLSEFDLGLGAGHFYAYRLVKALDVDTSDGVLRASFVHYTTAAEISRLISALDAVVPDE
jgi:cysteine desulfurase family protein (TIGR01976 family)